MEGCFKVDVSVAQHFWAFPPAENAASHINSGCVEDAGVNPCPYVICRVERESLAPVQQVDSLDTAYSHLNQLKKRWPGDYLIFEDKNGDEIGGRAAID